ncbi:hypothetical protein F4825DRAFT_11451 [Nemania diffusa]|nr:hypothetical protein F4825DRAFT_11451 [Nemania diffusa]
MSNSVLRPVIERYSKTMFAAFGREVPEGEVACLLESWEAQKRSLDFSQPGSSIVIHGNDRRSSIQLFAEELQNAHEKAFCAALEVAHSEIQKQADLKKDFVAVFTGGSVRNKGVKRILSDRMQRIEADAAAQGFLVKHLFLPEEYDTWWYVLSRCARIPS